MPETAGEYVDIPALLKGILNGYPGNTAIFREYLQNTDDAQATTQDFVLDERVFASERLLDPSLNGSQGSALLAINNKVLEETDWTALQKIHSSSKAQDESRTGKNGLGFRASYHLTENPHLLSGRKLLVLDAHRHFSPYAGGVLIDFVQEGPNYPDQMAPFLSYLASPDRPYTGTIFRFPLRTEAQAQTSRIKDTATSVEEMLELLETFCTNEAEETILFLKYTTQIKVTHVQRDGNTVVLGMVKVENEGQRGEGATYRHITITHRDGSKTTRTWCIYRLTTSREQAAAVIQSRLGYDALAKLHTEKLSAVVELAFPLAGPHVNGRLFTLLPLPISTGFPVHLNATFALTPDRQSLKNLLEVGNERSRERLLVEWNKIVFALWAPAAWAGLLVELANRESVDPGYIWSTWPPQQLDKSTYWADLPGRLVQEVINRRLPVFPCLPRDNLPISFVSLHDPSVLLAGPHPGIALDSLVKLDVGIVQPPPYLFSIITSLRLPFNASILSPQSLYERLIKTYSETRPPPCDETDVHIITDYLASLDSLPTIDLIRRLAWFSCTDSDHSRVALGSVSKRFVIPLTEEETILFGAHPHMLSWGCMSERLHAHASNPSNFVTLNISTLKPNDVVTVLNTKFRHFQPRTSEIREEDHRWLVHFWSWMARWPKLDEFFRTSLNKCGDLYILPTAERSLRKLASHSFIFRNTDPSAVEAWRLLGVHPLHPDLAEHPASMMRPVVQVPKSAGYVPLLIRSCDTKAQSRLSQDALAALQKSIFEGLPSAGSSRFTLSSQECSRLAAMQVFRLRTQRGDVHTLGSIRGHAIYVKVDGSFPLPVQPDMDNAIYVDMGDEPTARFVKLVNATLPPVLSEVDFVRIAFDHWALQTLEEKDCVIFWIFDHLMDTPQELLARLKDIPFVEVEGTAQRVSPSGLVDPTSPLAPLYAQEVAKFPAGIFRTKYLPTMKRLGLLELRLDVKVLKERLEYLSTTPSDPDRFRKAKHLIHLLNQSWEPQFKPQIVYARSLKWMPCDPNAAPPQCLESPHQCRDKYSGRGKNENPFYFDLALSSLPVEIQIVSNAFREALGWLDVIRPEALVKQFRMTVDLDPSSERNDRLMALIHYLGSLHHDHKLSFEVVEDLIAATADKAWIPISKYGEDTVQTKFALLLPEIDLKPPFFHIENFQYPAFLEEMGCTLRPKLDVLVEELAHIDFESARGVAASIYILQEIANAHPGFDARLILIPGANNEGLPLHRVFFQDINFHSLSGGTNELVPTHSSVSRALAESLGVPFLSALMLDTNPGVEDENEEDEQMSEDFVNRVQGFLREFDVRYALNEFLANADDAKASEFALMLNTPADVGERFLSPAFQKLAGCSRLVLFNDATFSEADFQGLRHVGLGGKRGLANTHGRHGLGALSFYYFTDVVTVISGEYVMFLDPSGENLPPRRRGKRTALRRTIKQVAKQFPDQLKGCESLFKFNSASGFFEGTLFILPLKSSISEQPTTFLDVHDMVKASYKTLSANAFFFTTLKRISAYKNAESDNADHLLWSFEANRQSPIGLDDRYTRQILTVKHRSGGSAPVTEKWLIATSSNVEIPEIHAATAEGLNLSRESPLSVQLAVRTDNAADFGLNAKSSLFSTLQLPKLISLPFHINSRFAISSNRQNVVLHPAGSGNQLDPKTAYNIWILKELVPPLYLSGLDYLVHSSQRKLFYRDIWWLLNAEDDISKLVQTAFHGVLTNSNKLLFQDATNDWIPFHDAVFSASQPSQITELLTSIKASKFVLYEHLKSMASCKSAKTVDGRYVKHVLAVAGLQPIRNLITAKKLDSRGIARIMDYVRKEDDLAMLPLLVLASGTLVQIPDRNTPAVYRSVPPTVSALFSTGRFMANDYTLESAKRLLEDENINVVEITPSGMARLVINELNSRDQDAQKSWLDLFWRAFPSLPASPDLTLLEDGKIVQGSARTLKLSECKNDLVVYQSHTRSPAIEPSIANMLQKLGLEIVNVTANPILDDYLKPRFADTITNVLMCMEAKGIYNLVHWTEAERQDFSHWIRNNLPTTISKWKTQGSLVSPHFLKRVQIWNAQTFEGQNLHSAMGIKLLPAIVPPNHIRPFQKPDIILSEYSYTLYVFVQFLSQTYTPPKTLSAKGIMDVVDMPREIGLDNVAGITAMKHFVTSMLSLPPNEVRHACLRVPDRQGILRPIDTLFDDRVPLFSTALNFTRPSMFVHPAFQDLQDQFRGLGLHHQVNSGTFAICARAIQNGLQLHLDGLLERNVLFEMSDAAYEAYQTLLPTMLMMDENKWNSIDRISFIRRQQERRQGATYDVERYFDEPLPLLVSPSLCVRQSMQSIAWTQRALFHREPSAEVIALNPTIGVPSAKEVVEHLKVLAMRVAPHHSNNASVIDDLAATYTWLNAHIDDAQEYLQESRHLPLYLNVNDARNDTWELSWSRGTEMVLGLHYDSGGLKRVRRFLDQYSNLLDASGCVTMKPLNLASAAAPTQNITNAIQNLKTTYNEMRKAAELTDVALIPTTPDPDATTPAKDDPELRAHYSFLAATMPYVRSHAEGWSMATPGEIKFFGSSFGAKALLDFAYTGDFKRTAPTGDAELTTLLNDLLELLPIADEWDIPQFKHLIEHKIIHEYDMIQRLPHEYKTMVDQADQFSAENLRNALSEFEKSNADFLRVLQNTA